MATCCTCVTSTGLTSCISSRASARVLLGACGAARTLSDSQDRPEFLLECKRLDHEPPASLPGLCRHVRARDRPRFGRPPRSRQRHESGPRGQAVRLRPCGPGRRAEPRHGDECSGPGRAVLLDSAAPALGRDSRDRGRAGQRADASGDRPHSRAVQRLPAVTGSGATERSAGPVRGRRSAPHVAGQRAGPRTGTRWSTSEAGPFGARWSRTAPGRFSRSSPRNRGSTTTSWSERSRAMSGLCAATSSCWLSPAIRSRRRRTCR